MVPPYFLAFRFLQNRPPNALRLLKQADVCFSYSSVAYEPYIQTEKGHFDFKENYLALCFSSFFFSSFFWAYQSKTRWKPLNWKGKICCRDVSVKISFPDFCTFLLFRPRWTLGRWFAGPLTRSVVRLSPASFIWPQRAALTPSPIALSPNSPTPPWGLCANQGSTGDSNR